MWGDTYIIGVAITFNGHVRTRCYGDFSLLIKVGLAIFMKLLLHKVIPKSYVYIVVLYLLERERVKLWLLCMFTYERVLSAPSPSSRC